MAKFEREVEIDAPVQNAWHVLIDVSQWPKWFQDIYSVSHVGPIVEGTVFQWSTGDKNGTARES